MKLLLDENLSFTLCRSLEGSFPGTSHTRHCGLNKDADDIVIWKYARRHGFALLTKDRHFVEAALRFGAPPKVVWLRCGNRTNAYIERLLLDVTPKLLAFEHDLDAVYIEVL